MKMEIPEGINGPVRVGVIESETLRRGVKLALWIDGGPMSIGMIHELRFKKSDICAEMPTLEVPRESIQDLVDQLARLGYVPTEKTRADAKDAAALELTAHLAAAQNEIIVAKNENLKDLRAIIMEKL